MNFSTRALPYKSHPLYKLRIATLITAVVGSFLNIFAILGLIYNDSDRIPYFLFSFVLLFISLTFVLHDLNTYAASRASNGPAQAHGSKSAPEPQLQPRPAEDPEWPSKRLVITDLVLAILLQWLFWVAFFAIVSGYHRYYRSGSETIEAYANLANFAASIEHAIAFWKELLARKRAAWQRDAEARPCEGCGHVNHAATEASQSAAATAPAHGEVGLAGPSFLGHFGKGNITLPKWARGPNAGPYKDEERDIENEAAEATADEPLLVTPDESTAEAGGPSGSSQGYGTLDQSVESVGSVPETVVRKKDKGKKRQIEVE